MATSEKPNRNSSRPTAAAKVSRPTPAAAPSKKRPTARRVEVITPRDMGPEPLGGRFLVAAGLIAAALIIPFWTSLGSAIASSFGPKPPEPTDMRNWKTGSTAPMRITLITADYNLLSCASDKMLEGKHCEYKDEKTRWPEAADDVVDDNKRDVIQPYRTWPDNKLIMISGLWAEPHMAMRLHQEPPQGVPDKKLARFVSECNMRFIGEIDAPKLRWAPAGAWAPEKGPVQVAVAESCNVKTQF